MAKESDCFTGTVSVVKIFEAKSWPTAFGAAPDIILDSTTNQKKSGFKNPTSTGCDLSCESTGYRCYIKETGYEDENSNHPEFDSGQEAITGVKVYQSYTFGSTFTTAPSVVCGHESTTAGGKKMSCDNTTTTGGDIAGELGSETVHWLAVIRAFFNP